MKTLTRLAMLSLLTALTLFFAACGASRPIESDESDGAKKGSGKNVVRGDAVEMWIESDGTKLPIFRAEGRQYLLGRMGDPYEVVIANRSRNRVEVVLSVDGRDAVSGREADFRANRGYVLDPGEKTRVQGFRTSLEGVAAFEFTAPDNSYSSRMGTPENVGVIGLAVFDESEDYKDRGDTVIAGGGEGEDRDYPRPAPEYGAADSAPSAQMESAKAAGGAAPSSPGLGTKYGEELDSSATIVPFVRRDAEEPLELLALYYDDRAGLEALGIELPPEEPTPHSRCGEGPNPFPGVPCDDGGFAPPPPLHQED
jgi:hypothetical protein